MKLTADQRRALALIAESDQGVPERLLIETHGFALVDLARLVRAGYASVMLEKERAGAGSIEAMRMAVTDAGRRALAH
jgi:hypothetical protein